LASKERSRWTRRSASETIYLIIQF